MKFKKRAEMLSFWYTVIMNNSYTWYTNTLVKPTWAPPGWLFGPVWTVLYAIIAVSYGYVGYLFVLKKIPFIVVLPFILNIIFNALFTPLQFGLQNNLLATIDILLVLGTLIWALAAIYKYVPWVTYVNIPYLAWVCFATVLQITVTVMNW
jgi:tryptophan-rich sensory protein